MTFAKQKRASSAPKSRITENPLLSRKFPRFFKQDLEQLKSKQLELSLNTQKSRFSANSKLSNSMGSSDSFEVNNIVSNSEEQAQQLLYELTQLVGQIAIEERALKQTSNSKIGSLDAKYLQKLDSRDALMSDLEKQFGQLPLEHGLEPIDPFLHAYK